MVASITIDTKQMEREVKAWSEAAKKQLPFAIAGALTAVAFKARKAMPAKARADLDRPTPFTSGVGAFYVKKADKRTLTAEVGFKDIQARYMQYQIAGGHRRQTGYEKFLQGIGALPPGWITTPGPAAPRDAYGNIRRKDLSAMLASLQRGIGQFKSTGRGKNRTTQLQAFFVAGANASDPRVRKLAPGVWQRLGVGRNSRIVPWLLFAPGADYKPKRFDFELYVGAVVRAHIVADFKAAFDRAMATAL